MYHIPDSDNNENEDSIEDNEETIEEDLDNEGQEAGLSAKLVTLRKKLKEAQQAKMQAMEEGQRVKADYLNSRKRLEEQSLRDKARATDAFVESLFPMCDSFEMAKSDAAAWEAIDPMWRKGMEGVYQQLQQLLADYGVTTIMPLGEMFDPNLHEALSTEDTSQASETITKVIQAGYERNGNVIRAAKVIISN